MRYLRHRQRDSLLYQTRSVVAGTQLPVLFDATGAVSAAIDPCEDTHVFVTDHARTTFHVDRRLIRRRQRAGATLWDGNLLYVRGADLTGQAIRVNAGVCNYFSYVTFSDRMSRQGRRRTSSLLDSAYSDLASVLSGVAVPVVIAAATTCVFTNENGKREVAIQRRSSAVVSGVGELAVIPAFGLEDNAHGQRLQSRFSLIFYNFAKEFVEEFYGLEELTRAATSPHVAPDWIFQVDPARQLLEEQAAGRLQLRLTGIGSDLTDGSVLLALLAKFTSPAFLERLKLDCIASWESQGVDASERPIDFVPLEETRTDATITAETMYPSSLFSFDLACLHLESVGAGPIV